MKRPVLLLVIAAFVAAGCIRLGMWQLSRLRERQALNALVRSRLAEQPTTPEELLRDSASVRFRRLAATGVYDYDRELLYGARVHQGSPGVNFLTPLRLAGRDTVLIVNRGWVYAPDAATADRARWRERDSVTVHGYAEPFPDVPPQREGADPRVLYRLDRNEIARRVGAPVYPFYLVLTDSSDRAGAERIARVQPPPLDEGSHRSYAFQWFSFAAIAIAGASVLAFRRRRVAPGPGPRRNDHGLPAKSDHRS